MDTTYINTNSSVTASESVQHQILCIDFNEMLSFYLFPDFIKTWLVLCSNCSAFSSNLVFSYPSKHFEFFGEQ